jgi:hypothetical protein
VTDNVASPYWGIQELDSFPEAVLEVFNAGERYVDITAGGGGMVFERAKHQPVHGNDRNPFAAAAFQVANHIQNAPNSGPSELTRPGATFLNRPGWISSNQGTNAVPLLSHALAEYVDGLCQASFVSSYFATRVLLKNFSSRARAWDKDLTGTQDVGTSVDDFHKMFIMEYAAFANEVTSMHAISGTNQPAENCGWFIFPGDVVYSDPAWPWTKDASMQRNYTVGNDPTENPYTFLTCAVGSIYLQRDLIGNNVPFWTQDDPTQIYSDCYTWISNAFLADAKTFVLSTQGTNFPDPSELYVELESRGLKLDQVVQKQAYTRNSKTPFVEYFGVFQNG